MPAPKFVECTACKELFASLGSEAGFACWGNGEPVRLLNNPGAWGADRPRFSLLGFSKGATQNKAIAEAKKGRLSLEEVPFKGMRKRLGWLLDALGVRRAPFDVNKVFTAAEQEIRSGSLIRCSISAQISNGEYSYKLADILAADSRSGGKVKEVLRRCIRRYAAPDATNQTFIILGLDQALIDWTRDAFRQEVGPVHSVTDVTYRSEHASWVHVAHPSGNLTDSQYQKWCRGEGKKPKVLWAKAEVAFRSSAGGG